MRKRCLSYDRAYEEVYKSEKLKGVNRDNAELYEYLSKNTGNNVSSVLKVEWLYNTLQIEELNNLTLPEWTRSVYPDKMRSIAAFALTLFTDNEFMKRMKGGGVFHKMFFL